MILKSDFWYEVVDGLGLLQERIIFTKENKVFDIIGDIHGCAFELFLLLEKIDINKISNGTIENWVFGERFYVCIVCKKESI